MNYYTPLFAVSLLLCSANLPTHSQEKTNRITDRVLTQTNAAGHLEVFALPNTHKQLMGYTDQPVPADIEMPESMKAWLKGVQQATTFAENHPESRVGAEARQSASYPVIEPLLGKIEWGQDAPFNALCPSGTPAGCVATAAVQVMYYWRYPERGAGSHSYTYGGKTHSVDFSEQTYNWDLMFDKHNHSCTDEQNAEVAKLSYHVGVAIDMQYNAGGSGAWTEYLPQALSDYFGYNANTSNIYRQNYSYDEWNARMIAELEAGRPIVFAGNSEDAGHAFVIDGINKEGLYHVNWGWNGYYNGFYDICILNPGGAGTGATVTELGFCFSQVALINLTPEPMVGEKECIVKMGYMSTEYRSDTEMQFWSFIENVENRPTAGEYGIDIADSEGNTVRHTTEGKASMTSVYSFHGWDSCYFTNMNATIKIDSLPDGEYSIKPFWKPLDSDISYYIPSDYYNSSALYFSVANGVFGSKPERPDAINIQTSNFSLQGQSLSSGRPYTATLDVYNAGTETYVGTLYMLCNDELLESNTQKDIFVDAGYIRLAAGETRQVTFTIKPEGQGEWRGNVNALNRNIEVLQSNCMTDGEIHYTYKYDENSPAKIVLHDDPVLLTEQVEADGEISFEMDVDNLGGIYNDDLILKFFTQKLALENETLALAQKIDISSMEENHHIAFTEQLTELKSKKKYYARFFVVNAYGEEEPLQKYKSDGTLTNASPIEIKVYEPTGIEEISCEDSATSASYDLMGRRIDMHRSTRNQLLIRNGQLIHAPSIR